MRRIFKYRLAVTLEPQIFWLGPDYRILSVGVDGEGHLAMWALVEANEYGRTPKHQQSETADPTTEVELRVAGTGWEVGNDRCWQFLGTATTPPYVWHVFQVVSA